MTFEQCRHSVRGPRLAGHFIVRRDRVARGSGERSAERRRFLSFTCQFPREPATAAAAAPRSRRRRLRRRRRPPAGRQARRPLAIPRQRAPRRIERPPAPEARRKPPRRRRPPIPLRRTPKPPTPPPQSQAAKSTRCLDGRLAAGTRPMQPSPDGSLQSSAAPEGVVQLLAAASNASKKPASQTQQVGSSELLVRLRNRHSVGTCQCIVERQPIAADGDKPPGEVRTVTKRVECQCECGPPFPQPPRLRTAQTATAASSAAGGVSSATASRFASVPPSASNNSTDRDRRAAGERKWSASRLRRAVCRRRTVSIASRLVGIVKPIRRGNGKQ